VRLYDPDMEQMTVRPYSTAMGATPSLVLAGGGRLNRHFRVEEQGRADDLAWVQLVPRNPEETGFKEARVGLAADPARVVRFEFTDSFGNRSIMTFSDIRLGADIPVQRFRFKPPEGTDVVGPAAEKAIQP
jgi:outer membrane lipoprotein carrier protein